jgi:hypothetical protein
VQAAAGYRRPPTGHALDPAPGDRKYPHGAAEDV